MMKTIKAALKKKSSLKRWGSFIQLGVLRYHCCQPLKIFPANKVFLASIRVSGGAVENQWVRTGKITQERWVLQRAFAYL